MWNIKNKEAVSPVIGVILMVAITVVLAAVLYVCVSGFMTAGGGGAAPTAALGAPTTSDSVVYKSSITSISAKVDEAKAKIYILHDDVALVAGGSTVTRYITTTTVYSSAAGYIDNDNDGLISTYDILVVNATALGATITAGDTLRLADTSGNTIGTVLF